VECQATGTLAAQHMQKAALPGTAVIKDKEIIYVTSQT
jgi:hypothetical protein